MYAASDLEAANHLTTCIGEHLSVLGGDDRRDLVGAGVEDLAEFEQHRSAGGDRRGRPLLAGLGGPGEDGRDFVGRGERDALGHLADGRV